MAPAGADAVLLGDWIMSSTVTNAHETELQFSAMRQELIAAPTVSDSPGRRRTPRKSIIVVLPENHIVPAEVVNERLSGEPEPDQIGVILACAGQPNGISSLQHRVRDLQVLLAPSGTSDEDLRELAMTQASGDIVTLLNGTLRGG